MSFWHWRVREVWLTSIGLRMRPEVSNRFTTNNSGVFRRRCFRFNAAEAHRVVCLYL